MSNKYLAGVQKSSAKLPDAKIGRAPSMKLRDGTNTKGKLSLLCPYDAVQEDGTYQGKAKTQWPIQVIAISGKCFLKDPNAPDDDGLVLTEIKDPTMLTYYMSQNAANEWREMWKGYDGEEFPVVVVVARKSKKQYETAVICEIDVKTTVTVEDLEKTVKAAEADDVEFDV